VDEKGEMLNLNDLFFFVKVVDDKGFASAARQLGVPKSTLSKRVAVLEAALGVRLIHRSSRRFVMTEVGQDLHRHAAAMLIEAEAAENVVKGRLAGPLLDVARLHPKIHIRAARHPASLPTYWRTTA
jgi:DNA-binding transcriptional LysR family regulator